MEKDLFIKNRSFLFAIDSCVLLVMFRVCSKRTKCCPGGDVLVSGSARNTVVGSKTGFC